MLRHAIWVPTKEDEQAVSTASTQFASVNTLRCDLQGYAITQAHQHHSLLRQVPQLSAWHMLSNGTMENKEHITLPHGIPHGLTHGLTHAACSKGMWQCNEPLAEGQLRNMPVINFGCLLACEAARTKQGDMQEPTAD